MSVCATTMTHTVDNMMMKIIFLASVYPDHYSQVSLAPKSKLLETAGFGTFYWLDALPITEHTALKL